MICRKKNTNLCAAAAYKQVRSKRRGKRCMYRDAAQSVEHLYCSCCGTQLGTRCERCGCKVSAKDSFCCHCGNEIK